MTFEDRVIVTPIARIRYWEQGSGEPLLLLHSNGMSRHQFRETMTHLSQHYRCIAWDYPGHGDSEPLQRHLSVADYAQITIAVLDALKIEQAHVCGASIGGLACIALAAAAPERVLALTIVESVLRTPKEWEAEWPRIESSFAITHQIEASVAPRFRQLTPALLERWNIDRSKAGGWRMVDVMWAIRDYDALADLHNVKNPCVVVFGDKGPAVVGMDRYTRAQPDAAIKVMRDAGHFPMVDDPAAFADAVHAGIVKVMTMGA